MKRGQLGIIEFKYFMTGLLIGLFAILVVIALGSNGTIPFQVPLVWAENECDPCL